MLAGELWVYEDEAQVQEVVAKAVERNVVQEYWESEEEVVPQLLEAQEAQEVQDHHSHHLPLIWQLWQIRHILRRWRATRGVL